MSIIGVPVKVLHEAEGHIVTVETTTGEVYRGKLIEAEDNMNSQMASVTVTYRDGRVAQLENIYIRLVDSLLGRWGLINFLNSQGF